MKRAIKVAMGTKTVTMQEVAMLKTLLAKILPDLQAIAIAVEDNTAMDRGSIDAQAAAHGIDISELWGDKPVIEGKSEVIEPELEDSVE